MTTPALPNVHYWIAETTLTKRALARAKNECDILARAIERIAHDGSITAQQMAAIAREAHAKAFGQ